MNGGANRPYRCPVSPARRADAAGARGGNRCNNSGCAAFSDVAVANLRVQAGSTYRIVLTGWGFSTGNYSTSNRACSMRFAGSSPIFSRTAATEARQSYSTRRCSTRPSSCTTAYEAR
jgi:hypothetical protein